MRTLHKIRKDKDVIIRMYNDNVPMVDIAKKYDVVSTSICQHLKKWGVEVKRRPYQIRVKKIKRQKRNFSPELRAKMKENSRINNEYIKHCEFEYTTEDQRLVTNIINRPIIG